MTMPLLLWPLLLLLWCQRRLLVLVLHVLRVWIMILVLHILIRHLPRPRIPININIKPSNCARLSMSKPIVSPTWRPPSTTATAGHPESQPP